MKKLLKISLTLIITLIIVLGFAMPLNPVGNWYQQFLPNLNGRTISDITFLDSLTGYASARQTGDTSYILKTTNGGDNWQIVYRNFFAMTQMQFLNVNTGYAVGAYLFKTSNGGMSWNQVTAPAISPERLFVLNEDTIWLVSSNSLTGGVFWTTNGGANWQQQINLSGGNPDKIYFFNGRFGFISNSSAQLYRTTNCGVNWNIIPGENAFTDMYFIDSLTGWKASGVMKKTTNGGLNWVSQTMPFGGIIIDSDVDEFVNINKDTIWACGPRAFYGGGRYRGILLRTTNGGANWLFQIPDTSYGIPKYLFIDYINKRNGWAYHPLTGIHTTNGGDTTFLLGLQQISAEVPKEYKLYQNYPNPFNPTTNIKYSIMSNVKSAFGGQMSNVKLTVYDITGKEIAILVNTNQNTGTYQIDFNGSKYSSGVYFYKLFVSSGKEAFAETKKMILIK